jgi:hypothetical protein
MEGLAYYDSLIRAIFSYSFGAGLPLSEVLNRKLRFTVNNSVVARLLPNPLNLINYEQVYTLIRTKRRMAIAAQGHIIVQANRFANP